MARDFDIKRVREGTAPNGASQEPTQDFWPDNPKPKTKPVKNTSNKSTVQKATWPALLLILGLGLGGAALYSQYAGQSETPETKKLTPNNSQTQIDSTVTAEALNQSAFDNSSTLLVQVYDSGAGIEATESATAALKTAGYDAKNLGKSQFEYDKTYIWHTPKFQEQAKAAATVLTGREISYKQSQIEGVFDVLIYVGKK